MRSQSNPLAGECLYDGRVRNGVPDADLLLAGLEPCLEAVRCQVHGLCLSKQVGGAGDGEGVALCTRPGDDGVGAA